MMATDTNKHSEQKQACGDFEYSTKKQQGKYTLRRIDKVILKGRTAATYLYEYIDWEKNLKNINLVDYLALFNNAFKHYESGSFKSAEKEFSECLLYCSNDNVVYVLLERSQEFAQTGGPADWDGVFTLQHK